MPMQRNPVFLQSPAYASRLYSRRRVDVRARVLARQQADGHIVVVQGRTVDLSRSGAGVTLTRELASGTEVVLCLQLPGIADPLFLRAVIRRRHGFRAGLEFVEPTAEQRLLLCRFCHA
jgi:PilZ domain